MSEDPPSPSSSTGSRSDEIGSDSRTQDPTDSSLLARELDLLSRIIDGLPGTFYLCNKDGRFLKWNRRFEEVSGFSAEDMRTARPMDFFDEQDRPAVESRVRKVFETGYAEIEARLRTKSGELIPYHFNGTLIEIDGEPYLMGLGLDISARVRAEAERDASASRARLAMAAARMGVWETDIEKGTQEWDDEYWRLFGCPESRPRTNDEFFRLVHPDDHERLYSAFERSLAGNVDYEAEYRILWPDGQVRWHSVLGHPIFDNDGKPLRVLGVGWDITERKRYEDALRSSEARLAAALAAVRMGTWVWDQSTDTADINQQEIELFGLEPNESFVSTQRLLERVHPDDREFLLSSARRAIAGGSPFEHEFRVVLQGGDVRWLAGRGKPVVNGEGHVRIYGVNYDITDKRRLEEQLRQSQKMEAFGQLAAGVAHDFNNLLTVISGYSDILLMRLATDDPNRKSVESIIDAARRAAALTRQLLTFTRLAVPDPHIIDLNAVVADLENMLRGLVGENIVLTTDLAEDLDPVRVDSSQIGQVLLNLVINARDAMPDGGRLTITTRNSDLKSDNGDLSTGTQPGKYVQLVVSDTGVGVEPDITGRIFEPFFTTKHGHEGTGLGLAVVHGIVKQSGGTIEVRSEPGATSFNVYLPAFGEHRSSREERADSASLYGNETILVLKEDESAREFTTAALAGFGYSVVEAADAASAVRIAQDRSEPIDLLVTHVGMPSLAGVHLAERLKEFFPQLKVLFISGYTNDDVVGHCATHEHFALLQKPFSPTTLAEKVRELLEHTSGQAF
jgi:two-component system cell cycle sensor histidine kinase/response regulator CckA